MEYRVQDARRGIIGPISLATLVELAQTGVVGGEATLSADGGPYLPISECPEVGAALRARPAAGPSVHGTLDGKTILHVLLSLYEERATGLLVVIDGGHRKDACLRDGQLVFLSSNVSSERLGDYLVARDRISREDLDVALASMHSDGGRLGETLVRLGLLEARELADELREHQLERLIELCCWRSGSYAYYRDVLFGGTDVGLDLSIPELIVRTVREMPEEMLLGAFADALDDIPKLTQERRAKALPWTEEEQRLLASIDGRRSLRAIHAASGEAKLQVLALTYALWQVQALELSPSK